MLASGRTVRTLYRRNVQVIGHSLPVFLKPWLAQSLTSSLSVDSNPRSTTAGTPKPLNGLREWEAGHRITLHFRQNFSSFVDIVRSSLLKITPSASSVSAPHFKDVYINDLRRQALTRSLPGHFRTRQLPI